MPDELVPVGEAAQKSVESARLTIRPVGGASRDVVFPLNPYQLRVKKTARWRNHISPDAVGAGATEWAGTVPRTLELAVVLDASDQDKGSVLPMAEDLLACCQPPAEAQGKTAAPKVRFSWGKALEFDAVMTDVSVVFTEFWPDGTPFRADVTLALRELTTKPGAQNPTSGGILGRRVHELRAGDTLASIAYQEYGNPARWRDLAEANGIDDPFRLRTGLQLSIPALSELGAARSHRLGQEPGHAS